MVSEIPIEFQKIWHLFTFCSINPCHGNFPDLLIPCLCLIKRTNDSDYNFLLFLFFIWMYFFLLVYATVGGKCGRAYALSNCPVFWPIYLSSRFVSIISVNIVATTSINDFSPIFFFKSCSLFINVTQKDNSKSIFFVDAKEREDCSVAQERSTVLWLSHSSCSAGCPGFS